MAEYKVWIDQDLCTGDGICTEDCEPLFEMHSDGLAYVKALGETMLGPDGQPRHKMGEGTVLIPDQLLDDAIAAAEDCPGDCIFIEEVAA